VRGVEDILKLRKSWLNCNKRIAIKMGVEVTQLALQVPRRVRRLEQQLQRVRVERRHDPLAQLRAPRVHVEVARLAPGAPLALP
jgi:hypothetical protein